MTAPDTRRDLLGIASLVVAVDVEAHGEGVDRAGADLARESRDGTRVDAAREEDAERHVGDELHPNRLRELFAQLLDARGALVRPRQLPVLAVPPLAPRAVGPVELDRQHARGRQELDSLHQRARADGEAVPEVAGHGGGVEPARQRVGREQRAHLRREQQDLLAAAGVGDDPEVQGLDAHRIPDEMHRPGPGIEQRQREDTPEAADGIDAPVPVRPQDDLGVGRRAEAVAERLELAADLGEVVDLAVERDHAPGLGIQHGLSAGFAQVDDREPPVAEYHLMPVRMPQAVAVRTAVALRVAHPPDPAEHLVGPAVGRSPAFGGDTAYRSGNSAHGSAPARGEAASCRSRGPLQLAPAASRHLGPDPELSGRAHGHAQQQ